MAKSTYFVNEWLDSRVTDPEDTHMQKQRVPTLSMNVYHRYYKGDTDQDIKSSDNFSISLLDDMKRNSPQEIRSDKHLTLLDTVTERYTDNSNKDKSTIKSVLIRPDTNRHHANFLFKRLVDFCDNNDFNYCSLNPSTYEYETMNLIDTSFKDSFYKFCYDNTHKKIDLYNY